MLAGHFYHTIGSNPTAMRHFLEAKKHYSEWEAFGMVQEIDIVIENFYEKSPDQYESSFEQIAETS